MTEDDATLAEPLSNSARLLKHLKEDALSYRIVQAHRQSGGAHAALKAVIDERLEQVRRELVSKD